MAARADARDLWGFAQELHRAASTIADIDAFHLLVYHAHEAAPMHFVLFANTETTWPGARHEPEECLGDSLALKLRRTVTQSSLPLPYGDAFNLYPSQLYIPILLPPEPRTPSESGIEYRVSNESGTASRMSHIDPDPLGVLCVMAGIHNFFPPDLRQAYEQLAQDSAPLLSHCLRPEPYEPKIF